MPTDRPILFSAPMVRALLDGTKTQTRRIVKCLTGEAHHPPYEPVIWLSEDECAPINSPEAIACCPYGAPGDRMWVKETYRLLRQWDRTKPSHTAKFQDHSFDADGPPPEWAGKKRPSIHMPRWASRITLEITGVRVERLLAISRGDAMSEGCPFSNMANGPDPRQWYADLWQSINGPGSWDANPWIWVISFQRVTP